MAILPSMLVPDLRLAWPNQDGHYATLAFSVAALVGAGCAQAPDPQAVDQVEIRLDVPDDPRGATVMVDGLSEATVAALRNAQLDQDSWTSLLRVAVHHPDSDPVDTPPILGDYEVGADDVVRFRPMFPFDAGREYVVTFDRSMLPVAEDDGAQVPVTTVFALPRPDDEPTTIVSGLFPSGTRIPENQLKLYIEFSAPMSHVDGLEHIRLLDSTGDEVDAPFLPLGSVFWDYDYQRYTVFFDPGRVKRGLLPNEELGRSLTAGQSYTLVVETTWPDAEGIPLKEGVHKKFTVVPEDTTPIDPSSWRFRVPAAGTTQRFVVSFPEPLDHGLLLRGLAVEDSSGRALVGNVEITNWETRWSFTPSHSWNAGAYSLIALSILEDLAGNRIGVPFEIDVFERIDNQTEQESYRIPFEISAASG